jgi:hypothetical protein
MNRKSFLSLAFILFLFHAGFSQLKWQNVDSLFQPLPASVHIYKTTGQLDGKPNIAYYIEAELKDRDLNFLADSTYKRRLTPLQYFEKNDHPLVVVNCTFFSFETNQNLNVVIKNKKLVGYNVERFRKSKADSTIRVPVYGSAIGIAKNRKADVAWLNTDSSAKFAMATQTVDAKRTARKRGVAVNEESGEKVSFSFSKWKMNTAVGGGPVLIQAGEIEITNDEEMKFGGKAINDRHPRTAMGYTKNGKLIVLVIEGRNNGIAEGATLIQEAQMLKDIGCWEALNLDGGGSSCMLVNGKETIKPSGSAQRPVPAVFIIDWNH